MEIIVFIIYMVFWIWIKYPWYKYDHIIYAHVSSNIKIYLNLLLLKWLADARKIVDKLFARNGGACPHVVASLRVEGWYCGMAVTLAATTGSSLVKINIRKPIFCCTTKFISFVLSLKEIYLKNICA